MALLFIYVYFSDKLSLDIPSKLQTIHMEYQDIFMKINNKLLSARSILDLYSLFYFSEMSTFHMNCLQSRQFM